MPSNSAQTSSLLLEIGTEDLPARFMSSLLNQMRENTEKILTENLMEFSGIQTLGTPRRLTVIADGVPLMQGDMTKEVFGPPRQVAFDKNGNPTKAAIGFANSQGVSVENLIIKDKDKGQYVVAVKEIKGVHVKDLLPDISKRIVLSLHMPKSMRWGYGNVRFIRPILWIMTLFGKDTVSFEIDGIKSNNLTTGHRFLSPAAFQIKDISGYKKLLANNFVIVDQEERKRIIIEKMEHLLASMDKKPVLDEDLLETVVNLVEYPVPVVGTFSPDYLKLPKELLVTVMKGHQKYFAVQDREGNITNYFVVISNTSEQNSDTVKIGAERVIKARFEDARFYFGDDVKKPLSGKIDELKKITFQDRLGNLYEKTERIESIAGFLAERIIPSKKEQIIRAAHLAKTDLLTGIVREFPELQGIMGKYYALHNGEDAEVAEALAEQYLPTHSGGKLPRTEHGTLLSIADKIDNISSFFSIDLIPSGSEDPFALRRQALGIIAMLLDRSYNLTLNEIVDKSLDNILNLRNIDNLKSQVLRFFENRLGTVFIEHGYSHDVVGSIISMALNLQLKDVTERLNALEKFKKDNTYNDFLTVIKRVNNIIPDTSIPELREELLLEKQEKSLNEKLESVRSDLTGLIKERKYYDAIKLFSTMTDPINNFFDNILVMDKREEIKQNRLALLKGIWETVSTIANFSKLSAS